MKISKKTIIKAAEFVRNLFFGLFALFTAFFMFSVDGPSFWLPIIYLVIGIVSFGISAFLDNLLWKTAWNDDMEV